jgi:hypothetical protein
VKPSLPANSIPTRIVERAAPGACSRKKATAASKPWRVVGKLNGLESGWPPGAG